MLKKIGVPLLLVILGIVVLGYIVKSCRAPDDPTVKIPAHTARTIDSLDRTRPTFDSSQQTLHTLVIHDTIQATRFQEAARRATGDARRAQSRADSLALVASGAADSAAAWHAAYEARTREAEGLRVAVAQKDSALAHDSSAFANLSLAYRADSSRRREIERVNADLRTAIARLDVPCRIVGPIRCPSRTTTAVLAGALGALAGAGAWKM